MTDDLLLMEVKRNVLWKTYFTKEDRACIEKWKPETVKQIWQNIYDKRKILSSVSTEACPFCIKQRGDCYSCQYAVNHKLQCSDHDSTFQKNMRRNEEKVNFLTPKWYYETIEKINDQRTTAEKDIDRQAKILILNSHVSDIANKLVDINRLLKELEV